MIDSVKEVKIGSLKTGLDPQTFQAVSAGLEASGSSADAFATALLHVAQAMEEAKETSPEGEKIRRSFAALGVSLSDIETKSRQAIAFQLIGGLREAAREGKLTEEQLTALKAVFGKAAIEFVPFIARGTNDVLDQMLVKGEEELALLGKLRRATAEWLTLWKVAKESAAESIIKHAPEIAPRATLAALAIHKFVFGDPKETKAAEAGADKMESSVQAQLKKRAEAKVAERAAEDAQQSRREKIAQLEYDRDEALAKTLTKEERKTKLLEKQAELKRRLETELDDVRRAQLQATLAENAAEQASLASGTRGDRLKPGVTDAQRIGALIRSPGDNDGAKQSAAHLREIKEQNKSILGTLRAIDYDIRKTPNAFS
jgi:hypothetical protein